MRSDVNIEAVWDAAAFNTLLELTSEAPYRSYALALLFLKFASDLYEKSLEEHTHKYRGDEQRIVRAMSRERFVVPERCRFARLLAEKDSVAIGSELNKAFAALEDANMEKLGGMFGDIDFNKVEVEDVAEHNRRLRKLIEALAQARTGNEDLLGDRLLGGIYEDLIEDFALADRSTGSEFYTPREICQLVVSLVAPTQGERIYDPACGSGGFLLNAAYAVGSRDVALFGQERSVSAWMMCRMNLFLHDLDAELVGRGDAIGNPLTDENESLRRFDVVMTRAPFSLTDRDGDVTESDRFGRFRRGLPTSSRNDYAFISHVVATLRDKGRAAVVVPVGSLFRGGNEGLVRARLIEDNLVDGVIELPPNLFLGTGISTALLMFRSGKSDRSVFFINASRGSISDKGQARLQQKHVRKIASAWEARESVPHYASVTTVEAIAANKFNLNVALYVQPSLTPDLIDVDVGLQRVRKLERRLKRARSALLGALESLA
jgi:type I restriction enzyme M protein